MSDAHSDSDDVEANSTETFADPDDIPETAHITACGDVISNDGEHIGEIEARGTRSSTPVPHPSDGGDAPSPSETEGNTSNTSMEGTR